MELALHLGKTLEELEQMSAPEYGLWLRHASQRMLPWRRMELYLAQIARLIAVTMGGAKDAKLIDFMFEPEEEISTVEDATVVFEFAPRKLKGQ